MRNWLFRVKVAGESMWPTLVSGKNYWASSLLPLRTGSIVVARTNDGFIVKSVQTLNHDQVVLKGTVSWSSSYKIDRSAILGRLII